MPSIAGRLGDSHALSVRARRYANDVIFGDEWPLTPEHVDLDAVTFETSTRMERKHGVCCGARDGRCRIRLSEKTADRGGDEAIEETIRHELVHAFQFQDECAEMGHGPSFKRWLEPLALSGRCSEHYVPTADEYAYSFHCPTCGFLGGRYRMCKTVRAGLEGRLRCQRCDARDIAVRDQRGRALSDADRE